MEAHQESGSFNRRSVEPAPDMSGEVNESFELRMSTVGIVKEWPTVKRSLSSSPVIRFAGN
jgi:hypothetical protein